MTSSPSDCNVGSRGMAAPAEGGELIRIELLGCNGRQMTLFLLQQTHTATALESMNEFSMHLASLIFELHHILYVWLGD